MRESIAGYEADLAVYNELMGGGGGTDPDSLHPLWAAALPGAEERDALSPPSKSKIVKAYELWKANQSPGSDVSEEAFIKWYWKRMEDAA